MRGSLFVRKLDLEKLYRGFTGLKEWLEYVLTLVAWAWVPLSYMLFVALIAPISEGVATVLTYLVNAYMYVLALYVCSLIALTVVEVLQDRKARRVGNVRNS